MAEALHMTSRISYRNREVALQRLTSQTLDLVVVGGGVTGAGVALEAASRGLRVALLERGDFASGTSSKSSRLIHGGLRYLEHAELDLVAESLSERNALLRDAPHLVRKAPFVIPFLRASVFSRRKALLRIGLSVYDVLARLPRSMIHSSLSTQDVTRLAPSVDPRLVDGGLLYWDAITDDARVTLATLRTAAASGAIVLNYCEVTQLEGSPAGVAVGFVDYPSGTSFVTTAKGAVIAAGAWAAETSRTIGIRTNLTIVPARGAHLTLDVGAYPGKACLLLPAIDDERFVFVIPYGEYALLGTTDSSHPPEEAPDLPTPAEVAYLVDTFDKWSLRAISDTEVLGGYAGIRPLVADSAKAKTKDISRRHVIEVVAPRCIVVTGGKFTTYRKMARDTIDLVCSAIPGISAGARCGSRPRRTSLLGACDLETLLDRVRHSDLVSSTPYDAILYLWRKHGSEALDVLVAQRTLESEGVSVPDAADPALRYVAGEAVLAFEREGALTTSDVLVRRLRWGSDRPDAVAPLLPVVEAAGEWAAQDVWSDLRRRMGHVGAEELRRYTVQLPARIHDGLSLRSGPAQPPPGSR